MLKSFVFTSLQHKSPCNFAILLFIFFTFSGVAQVSPKITTTSQGSASGANNQVQQSIGQSSVIGTYQSNLYTVSQGFIQPAFGQGKIIDAGTKEIQVEVYPNPVTSKLTLEFQDAVKETIYIELRDILGNKVYQSRFQATQKMDIELDNLATGMYFLKLNTGIKVATIKIIKE